MLWRGGLAFPDACCHRFKGLALGKLRQGRVCGVLLFQFRLFQPHAVEPFNFLPTCLQDGLSFRCEGMACTIQYHRDRLKAVRLAGGAKEPHGDQRQNIPFPGRESRQVRPGDLHGGNNGMVVGDFTAIRYPVNIRFFQASFPERHVVPQPQDQGGGGCLHILGQILAVGTGIGRQLFLIEGLQVVKGLLGGVAVDTVTFPLQGRQIIEAGRLYGLYLLFH